MFCYVVIMTKITQDHEEAKEITYFHEKTTFVISLDIMNKICTSVAF